MASVLFLVWFNIFGLTTGFFWSYMLLLKSLILILHSTKFSRVFNFAIFTNFYLFTKLFWRKFLTREVQFSRSECKNTDDDIPELCCWICKGCSSKRYRWSRHGFADSCELEWMMVWWYILGLYATSILHYMHMVYTVNLLFQWNIHHSQHLALYGNTKCDLLPYSRLLL